MDYIKYDNSHILKEHKQLFNILFETLDISKVVFVGGIADYLNLRPHFQMPINDIDLCFRSKAHIAEFAKRYPLRRYPTIYTLDAKEVYTGDCKINGRLIHCDLFRQESVYIRPIAQSTLLGQKVLHTNFEGMKAFHNEHIEFMSSDLQAEQYNWKRLYKHSRKASLYNLLSYREEKELQAV